ncbi:MAG: triose-phosphate isomerase [Clostridiales bacterium GWC2_40_7]|nr:MAG: triose-phosphate isomerase [Clostridiales bacterium GWC2_40_7]
MKEIFVNLKRFEVPKNMGGICAMDDSKAWIQWVMEESVKSGIGKLVDMEVTFLLPEALIIPAVEKLAGYGNDETRTINIGCQGVFREDVTPGGNFGAFTTNRPAAAVKNIGCSWSIIGHSEERKDKLGIIVKYDPAALENKEKGKLAKKVVDKLINEEVLCALNHGIKVLLCVGESAEEKGDGGFEEQKSRIREVLGLQLELGLKNTENERQQRNIVIGYEPIWAIGPGKTPPGAEYIAFVSAFIKSYVKDEFEFDPVVVYGGGLKEENAEMISRIETIGGGLVALTRFSGDIGFYPGDLKKIINKYI